MHEGVGIALMGITFRFLWKQEMKIQTKNRLCHVLKLRRQQRSFRVEEREKNINLTLTYRRKSVDKLRLICLTVLDILSFLHNACVHLRESINNLRIYVTNTWNLHNHTRKKKNVRINKKKLRINSIFLNIFYYKIKKVVF